MTQHRGACAGNKGRGSHWIRDEKRRRIYERDGWRCWACLQPCSAPGKVGKGQPYPAAERLATVGHVLARARGGGNEASNLALECEACNVSRSDDSAIAWAFRVLGPSYGGSAAYQNDCAKGALVGLLDRLMRPLPLEGPC